MSTGSDTAIHLVNIGVFALLGASLAGSNNNNINGSILLGTDYFYKKQFKYNRTQELEADIFSIKALNKLKKSSLGLNNFFRKIEERNKMELWSLATLELIDIEGEISNLTLEVLKKNKTTPMIKVDNNGAIEINNIYGFIF